jgi:Do/DeqQ family serine protease
MKQRKLLYSKSFFLMNLVLVGVIMGFVLSMVLFSCSTEIRPSETALAQEAPPSLEDLENVQNSFRFVADAVLPSVVKLNVEEVRTQRVPRAGDTPWFDFFFGQPDEEGEEEEREFRTQGLGSGVIVRRDGETYYVLTNNHVVGEADNIQVVLDDEREYSAELVGRDERKDLALISFEAETDALPVARLGDSDSLYVGDWVLAIGSPFGFQSTVTAGIVSALGRRGGPQGNISDFIQTDASINQGNSGGALVNLSGEVVGINTWITSSTGVSVGLGFAIPINNAKRAIDQFIESGSVEYGWLGVSIPDAPDEVLESMGLEDIGGAFVHQVFLGSPADEGGILPGDYIVSLNGQEITASDELVLLVGDLPVGDVAEFGIIRMGERITVTVTIAKRQEEREIAEQNRRLWPGMRVFPLTEEVKSELDVGRRVDGVIISLVESRSPAAIAGFRVGDVITRIDETPIEDVPDFYRALNDLDEETLDFYYLRDGVELNVGIER